MTTRPSAAGARVKVWDPFLRFYHGAQAGLIALAWALSDSAKAWHEDAGLALAGLLALRIGWGFIGPRHARFSDFLRSPRAIAAYLAAMARRQEPRYLGHNPAGGAMVVALMAVIAATALTGWMQTLDAFWGSAPLQYLHETLADLIWILVAAHLGGVLLASLRHRENLAAAMIHGWKRP